MSDDTQQSNDVDATPERYARFIKVGSLDSMNADELRAEVRRLRERGAHFNADERDQWIAARVRIAELEAENAMLRRQYDEMRDVARGKHPSVAPLDGDE